VKETFVHRQHAAEAAWDSRATSSKASYPHFRRDPSRAEPDRGARAERHPRGLHSMDRHHRRAEQQHAELVEFAAEFGSVTSTTAASTTPSWLPSPPSTTMASTVADSWKPKLSGLMSPGGLAKKAPAMPPSMALMAKAESLTLVGLIPSARQAISSSPQRLPGEADRQSAQPEAEQIGEQRQQQDHVIKKYDALPGIEIEVEELAEAGDAPLAD